MEIFMLYDDGTIKKATPSIDPKTGDISVNLELVSEPVSPDQEFWSPRDLVDFVNYLIQKGVDSSDAS